MIEKYSLTENTLPTLPTPHDCVIEKITMDSEWLVFTFEKSIALHDSVRYSHPKADSLIIRYHLYQAELYVYKEKFPISILNRSEGYVLMNCRKLILMAEKKPLSYLYHNIGYGSIIFKLFCGGYILMDAQVDQIEYEWIEKDVH